jgi:hypothetical protein
MKATVPASGSSGVCAASSRRNLRCTTCSCSPGPWVNERRNVPSVEEARIPPNATGMAPCRSRSAPSMLSAPAHIAATSDSTFAAGFAPPLLPEPLLRIAAAARSGNRARSASRTTGTRPASATRFAPSNRAETAEAAGEDFTYEMPR